MTLNEYQERAMTTCMESCKNDTYMLFGLMAEAGEVADKIAKWKRKGIIRMDGDRVVFSAPSKDAGYLAEELMYEVGDIMWFLPDSLVGAWRMCAGPTSTNFPADRNAVLSRVTEITGKIKVNMKDIKFRGRRLDNGNGRSDT